MEDFLQMNEVWKEYFPNDPPTRATVSAGLVSQKMLVEVQAIAVCP
jgi:2-iminobutanoate/2-iminopropanoate deaminase